MAKDITKDLLEAIKATLPETQVGLIKEALNEREELKSVVVDLNKAIEAEKQRRIELNSDLKDLDARYQDLQNEAENLRFTNTELTKQNFELECKDIERRAELAEGKLAVVQETQELFLKNTIVRESVQTHMPVKSTSTQTQYVNGQPVQVPTTYTSLQPVKTTNEKTTDIEKDNEAT